MAERLLRRFAKSWTFSLTGSSPVIPLWTSLMVGYRSVAPEVRVRFPCSVNILVSLMVKYPAFNRCVIGSNPIQGNYK